MSWYEEIEQTLSMAIVRLKAAQRQREREDRPSTVADVLRRIGLLPGSHQAEQGYQCADGVMA